MAKKSDKLDLSKIKTVVEKRTTLAEQKRLNEEHVARIEAAKETQLKRRQELGEARLKFQGRPFAELTREEKDDLLEVIARQLDLIS